LAMSFKTVFVAVFNAILSLLIFIPPRIFLCI
jgi:hypothetical protein